MRKHKWKSLSKEQMNQFTKVLMIEKWGHDFSEESKEILKEDPLVVAMLKRKVFFKLPIEFSTHALFCISSFCNNFGHVMVLLIDAVEKYEGQTISAEMLGELYPDGFYSDQGFFDRVQELKNEDHPYSEVYTLEKHFKKEIEHIRKTKNLDFQDV